MNRRSKKCHSSSCHRSGDGGYSGVPCDELAAIASKRRTKRDVYAATAICAFLVLAVALVFGQTLRHAFIDYDDNEYVFDNQQVTKGITVEGVKWAFTSVHAANWHPITWLSHMADCQIYGLKPWGHHLGNVLLHGANAVLLFIVLHRMTGAMWRSGFVAMVFAVHPSHVQSVAWVAERKDVLSGLFFMLTLLAYDGFVRHRSSWIRYGVMILLYALGLMSKPMLVTLPFVLLLLDYWPLNRMGMFPASQPNARELRRLVVEKLPLLALAAASCVVTSLAQGKAVASTDLIPIPYRFGNALVSYMGYIGQFFCPTGLAVLYPYAGDALPVWKVGGALLAFSGICIAAVVWRRQFPFLFVGWFWYAGMLAPVIGIVQIGHQAMADRYTYLPQIGLCIVVAWGAAKVVAAGACKRWICIAAASLIVLMFALCAWQETSYWRNSVTLWTQTVNRTSKNFYGYNNLGNALAANGLLEEAIAQYEAALMANSCFFEVYNNMGVALAALHKPDEAVARYHEALKLEPNFAEAHCNLGRVLAEIGQREEALYHLQKALEIKPQFAIARDSLQKLLSSDEKMPNTPEQQRILVETPSTQPHQNKVE